MKGIKGKTNFYFSIVQDQDINLLNLLDISQYYRLLGHTRVICERIWEKGPYGAKTKLKLRLEIPLRVNPFPKSFFDSMTKNYPFPIFSPNLKSNRNRENELTAPFPRETIKKRYRSYKRLASFSTKTLKSLPMKKQYLTSLSS